MIFSKFYKNSFFHRFPSSAKVKNGKRGTVKPKTKYGKVNARLTAMTPAKRSNDPKRHSD